MPNSITILVVVNFGLEVETRGNHLHGAANTSIGQYDEDWAVHQGEILIGSTAKRDEFVPHLRVVVTAPSWYYLIEDAF